MYAFRQLVRVGLWLSLAVGIFLAWCNARAGAVPSQSSIKPKLASLNVAGTNKFKSEDVLAAIGFSAGQTIAEDDLKKALQYLRQCGAFSEVVYSQETLPTGVQLNFHVTDSEHFVPVLFDNIVWFSDEELLKELHRRVPLFRGELPLVGTLSQQVSDALQALLVERRLPHRVAYSMLEFELPGSDARQAIQDSPNVVNVSNEGGLPVHVRVAPPEVLQPDYVEVCNFHVTGPKIRMRAVNVRGAKEPELTELRVVASDLRAREYSRRSLRTLAEHGLGPVYLKNGYLKVAFGDPQASLVRKASEENEVDVTFSISPGKRYRWAGLEWSGVTIFPIETLEPYIHLARGHPANVVEFELDLDRLVEELYYSRGTWHRM